MDIRMEDIRITGTASVTWPEPDKSQEKPALPEQAEAVNEQEQED
jgi:hypothetical protein